MLTEFSVLLDSHHIKHCRLSYSRSYSNEDILNRIESLVKMVIVESDIGLILIALPSDQSIDFPAFKNIIGVKSVKVNKGLTPMNTDVPVATFVSEKCKQHEHLTFYTNTYLDLLKINQRDFIDLMDAKVAQFIIPKTYHVRGRHFAPSTARANIKAHRKCFLGFSMENASFEPAKVKGMVDWINKNFDQCQVLIGDSIHRNTLQINHGISEEEALKRSMNMAQGITEEYLDLFMNMSNHCTFDYLFCSEVQLFEEYKEYHEAFCELVHSNVDFAAAVHEFSKYFVNRRGENNKDFLRLSSAYLLEELAIFTCIAERGWTVFVYPANLGLFQDIANGRYLDVPAPLKSLINIQLDVRSRGIV